MDVDYRLLLDGIIVLLLVLTIAYASLLNRRLGRLRGGRAELEAASRSFAEAALRLDSNLKGLKATAEGAGGILQKRIDRASALSQQLGDLIDRSQTAVKVTKAPVKLPVGRNRHSRSEAEPIALRGQAAQAAAAVSLAEEEPLVLQDVAEEEPQARRIARRQFAMHDPADNPNGPAAGPAGGSDLADLLAALEELR